MIIQSVGADQNDLRLHLDAFRGNLRFVRVRAVLSTRGAAASVNIYFVSPPALRVHGRFFQPDEVSVRVVVFAGSPCGLGPYGCARAVHAGPLMSATDDQCHQRSQAWYARADYAQARLGRGPDRRVHKVPWNRSESLATRQNWVLTRDIKYSEPGEHDDPDNTNNAYTSRSCQP